MSNFYFRGYELFSFPVELHSILATNVFFQCFSLLDLSNSWPSANHYDLLCNRISEISDDDFKHIFAKPYRVLTLPPINSLKIFLDSLLPDLLHCTDYDISYVSEYESSKNPRLKKNSYDIPFRIVRNNTNDVGPAHFDGMYWDLSKGTISEVSMRSFSSRAKVWIPIMGCDSTNSLSVVSGSHLQDVPIVTSEFINLTSSVKGVSNIEVCREWFMKQSSMVSVPAFQQCNAILFHDKLVHKAPRNQTSPLRISLEFTVLYS